MRSPLIAAAPRSRFRRAGLRKTRTILESGISGHGRKLTAANNRGDVAAFLEVEDRSTQRVPMMAWSAVCGFPSPAEDYVDRPLDFNELLIEHPAATFAIRIEGESMTGAGIFPGDSAVVDRARGIDRGSQEICGVPMVRIHLPPAKSLMRT